MVSRVSRFIKRVTRSVRTCVQRVTRKRSRRNSTPMIPAVNVSRSSVGRVSADIASVGTESTSTQDIDEVPAADVSTASNSRISEPRRSRSITRVTVGIDDDIILEGSIYSVARTESSDSSDSSETSINLLEGVENERWYNRGKRRYIPVTEQKYRQNVEESR